MTVDGDGKVKAEIRLELLNRARQRAERAGTFIVTRDRDDDCTVFILSFELFMYVRRLCGFASTERMRNN